MRRALIYCHSQVVLPSLAMGKKSGAANNIVKLGGIGFMLLCSAILLWAYDNERWLVHTLLSRNRLQSGGRSESSEDSLSLVPDNHVEDNHAIPSNPSGANGIEVIEEIKPRVDDINQTQILSPQTNANAENPDAKQCDLFKGNWVYDESYVLYPPGQCPYSSEDFNCHKNGRKDAEYERWRWQPHDCNIPRFNASEVLEKLRNKRLMYVGDSINRNQWESMLCLLRAAVPQDGGSFKSAHGGKTMAFVIQACNCSVELSWAPFLVRQRQIPATNATSARETLQIDAIDDQAEDWKHADILVFNTGHWWTHEEPYKGVNFFEEGGFVHPHMEEAIAFEKSLRTWAKWVDANIDPRNTQIFFRTYSPVHFNGRMWGKKEGGGCYNETEPILKMEEEEGRRNPDMKRVWTIEKVVEDMKFGVKLLNVTWMSIHRKDAHSSVFNNKNNNSNRIQKNDYSKADCSHWCLPGLPDVWNHLLYALI